MTRHVVGVDLSLTGTASVLIKPDGEVRVREVGTKAVDTVTRTLDRFWAIISSFDSIASGSLAVVEGPAYGSTSGHAHDRGGLWWMAVDHLVNGLGIEVRVCPPATLKTYATGRGTASKAEVVAWCARSFPDVALKTDNAADALVLAAIAARLDGHPVDGDRPERSLKALGKVRA